MLVISLIPVVLLVLVNQASAQCGNPRTVSWRDPSRGVTHNYLFSWENRPTSSLEVSWESARDACRRNCMELVSIESPAENNFIKQHIASGGVKYIWTSGRRCTSCSIVDGWVWTGSGIRVLPSNVRSNGDWSHTGGGKRQQPDNRENTVGDFGYRGYEEECLSILNNFYNDGIRWHDVACYHTKPFVCESN